MRVTLGDVRDIGRQGVRWRPHPPDAVIVSPSSVRSKAVRIYHDETHSSALAYLDGRRRDGSRGLAGTFSPTGSRARQGQRTRQAFARYAQLEVRDGRPVADLALTGDVQIGSHTVGTTVDVVLFTTGGYSGRLLTWDLAGVTPEVADLMAVPAVLLIDQKLGEGTCVDIEVWDLENGVKWLIPRESGLSRLPNAALTLDAVEAAVTS